MRVITLARKPLIGSVAENVLRHGTGGLNIDGCRVTSVVLESERRTSIRGKSEFWGLDAKQEGARHNPAGRWPSNVILEHRGECRQVGTKKVKTGKYIGEGRNPHDKSGGYDGGWLKDTENQTYRGDDGLEEVPAWECHPDCPIKALDEQSGELHSQDPATRVCKVPKTLGVGVTGFGDGHSIQYKDEGGASRFFKQVQSKQDEP